MIKQSNPKAGNDLFKEEIDIAISRVLQSGWYILGDECQKFEKEFAEYNQTPYALGVGSGTDALEISLRAIGVEPGDQVATVSHTAVATVSAISRIGATPLFVDISDDYTLDPEQLRELLDQNPGEVKAIIVVHLYGQPADMVSILNVAEEFEVPVIEDCAQAHGALINGRKVGSFGVAGCFSFYPTKNLGAIGDGGIIVTNEKTFYDKVGQIRQYGWKERYISEIEGVNSRLDELQAAILRVKLMHIDECNQRRKEIAQYYFDNLPPDFLTLPLKDPETEHVFHQFVVQHQSRDLLKIELEKNGIGTAIHYPKAAHQQKAYCSLEFRPLPLSKTELVCSQILSLPMYPELTDIDTSHVCKAIRLFFDKFKKG